MNKKISKLQSDILAKVTSFSNKYQMPISHSESLMEDEDGSYIGVLWNYPYVLMDLSIFDENEVIFVLNEKSDDGTKIAAFDCVENSEKLFKSIFDKRDLTNE